MEFVVACEGADETSKINEYAKVLNQKYNFELYTEEYGGLEFFDWGFRYEDIDTDKVKLAEEMIKEVVAHLPDMKLMFRWTGDGSFIQREMISKNGVLVDVESWLVCTTIGIQIVVIRHYLSTMSRMSSACLNAYLTIGEV